MMLNPFLQILMNSLTGENREQFSEILEINSS